MMRVVVQIVVVIVVLAFFGWRKTPWKRESRNKNEVEIPRARIEHIDKCSLGRREGGRGGGGGG